MDLKSLKMCNIFVRFQDTIKILVLRFFLTVYTFEFSFCLQCYWNMNVLEILLTCLRQFELKVYSIAMANSATLYTVNEYPYIFKYFFHISRQAKKRGVSVG